MKITICSEVPSLNRLLRTHWATRRLVFNSLLWEITAEMNGVLPARIKRKKLVNITSYRGRQLDHDNLVGGCKFVLDALKQLGFIFDDSPRWIQLRVDQEIDRLNPRTEIEITEAKSDAI